MRANRNGTRSPTAEIRLATATIAAMFEEGVLDQTNLSEGLSFIVEQCAALDHSPLKLPIMTLDDVVAEAAAERSNVVQLFGGKP